jgi:dephospho-CoA kinase
MATTPSNPTLEALQGQIPFIGLTGGIGSGKSVVAQRLADLGATVIDADDIAHRITAPGGCAIPAIEATFGPEYITADGSLDRAKMRRLVFENPSALQSLEAITHPLIRSETAHQAALAHQNGAFYLLFVVPLLIESGAWRKLLDRLIVIDCPPEKQIQRVMQRSKLSQIEVEQIIAKQATRADRLAAADTVIVNDGSLVDLLPQVDALHQSIVKSMSKPTNSA